MASRFSALLFTSFLIFSYAFGQEENDPDREAPPSQGGDIRRDVREQIEKFHPKTIGMPADQWLKGYDKRLQMEAASPFGNLSWRCVGPEIQSGRVVDIEGIPGKPNTLFVGYATGGLWRTDDGGNSWTSLFDHYSSFGIGDFAIAKDGKTIWLGTGENNSQRTSYAGTGIFKSPDAGKTWQYMGLPESHHIGRILIDPNNPNTVYVGAMGHLYSQNPERGVYKTIDGGKTWQHVLKLDDQTGVIDLVMDPRDSKILYAAAWDRDRKAWDFRESGPGSGVYKSVDAGKTWKLISELPHGEEAGRIGLAISQSHPDRMYVYVDNHGQDPDWADADEKVPAGVLTPRRFLLLDENLFLALDPKVLEVFWKSYAPSSLKLEETREAVKNKKMTMEQVRKEISKKGPIFDSPAILSEVLRTDNGGKTWRQVDSGSLGGNSYYYFGNIVIDPKDPEDVFATGTQLTRTKDGGKTWRFAAREAHVDFHSVWFDPADSNHIAVGCDGGLYETRDDGNHWRHFVAPVGQGTTIAVDNKSPYNIYMGLQDNNVMKGPSNYRPGISDPNDWIALNGGDGSAVAVDPRDGGDTVYVGSQFGDEEGINQKTKERWSVKPRSTRENPLRFNWVTPVIVSGYHGDILYYGANKLFRSFNQGRSLAAISPDLTKNKPNGNVPFSTIKDISESPLQFGLIYVGCDDGNVKMTPDNGVTWKDCTTPTPDKWVSRVVASKYDLGTVYCAQSGYRDDDFAPYLYKSTDFGKTWVSIAGDLPNETINVIREDPDHKDMLFVGTDMGVFVSYSGGDHWEPITAGLPHIPVHDLVVQAREHDLVIATHARSAWVLPLELIYQLTPDIRSKDLTLFTVDDKRRDPNWGYISGRFNSPFIEAPTPTVKGSFYTKTAGPATVRILDKEGKVVKESTFDALTGYNFFELDLKVGTPGPKQTGKRVVRTAEDVLADPFASSRQQYLPVGDYTIEVTVNGKQAKQGWKLTG